jgi:hypothetical protein
MNGSDVTALRHVSGLVPHCCGGINLAQSRGSTSSYARMYVVSYAESTAIRYSTDSHMLLHVLQSEQPSS